MCGFNTQNKAKITSFKVTDKADPFLFYSLCVNEEDFQHLKSNQGLLGTILGGLNAFQGITIEIVKYHVECFPIF